jgi:hypothetical protein
VRSGGLKFHASLGKKKLGRCHLNGKKQGTAFLVYNFHLIYGGKCKTGDGKNVRTYLQNNQSIKGLEACIKR